MRFTAIAISLAVLAAGLTLRPTPNGAEDRVCENPSSSEVRLLYDHWAATLRGGNVEALTSLYSRDAILMGPAASSIRLGHREIAAYYSALVQHGPTARVIEHVVRTDCNAANDFGLEAVTFGSDLGHGGRLARFSLSYVLSGQRWLIVHHHQEILEPISGEFPIADSAASRIVTGANPGLATQSMPAQSPPPADANRRLPFVLPLARPTGPAPPIDFAALERLIAFAPPATIVLPAQPFLVAEGPPRIDPPQEPVRVISALLPRAIQVEVPAALYAVATGPPALPSLHMAKSDVPLIAERQPAHPLRTEPVIRPPAPALATDGPPAKPTPKAAVAGFSQRLPAPTHPVPVVQTAARSSTATARPQAIVAKTPAALTAKEPPRTGRFLRWEDSTPVFDD